MICMHIKTVHSVSQLSEKRKLNFEDFDEDGTSFHDMPVEYVLSVLY